MRLGIEAKEWLSFHTPLARLDADRGLELRDRLLVPSLALVRELAGRRLQLIVVAQAVAATIQVLGVAAVVFLALLLHAVVVHLDAIAVVAAVQVRALCHVRLRAPASGGANAIVLERLLRRAHAARLHGALIDRVDTDRVGLSAAALARAGLLGEDLATRARTGERTPVEHGSAELVDGVDASPVC